VLGRRTAKRVKAFDNGTMYVEASVGAQFLAWLIDFVVYCLGVGVGFVVLSFAYVAADLADGTLALLAVSLLFVVPLLYGLCYGNGRALGAVITGTQLVRIEDGGRVGGKACSPSGSLARTSIDPAAGIR
jgi:hypothetical protein